MKVVATIGVAMAMAIGAAGTGSAAQTDYGKERAPLHPADSADVQRTAGHSFWEVNNAGELVYWSRSGTTFIRDVRGWGWNNTHQITALSPNVFLEIKPDYRLARWTWNGRNRSFTEEIVGTGWQTARKITGIDSNRFLEINVNGNLYLWTFTSSGLVRQQIGTGWGQSRLLAGLGGPGYIHFFEVEDSGGGSEWYTDSNGQLVENPFKANFNDVRLMAGLDSSHFIFVTNDGTLWEYVVTWIEEEQGWFWVASKRGQGWNNSRLIG
ncbi:hypothetical protein LWC34_42510 [Kibdelosporangium philippinense]|uniref:Tachylectin n=1 Tax=Kibdelosporangium philippinense TaxID=211113 RepID=A0ABS8ZNW5_9PSEU|nr:hypothetical protein [Kibdelosporangium philippinense]MCE7009443.1 hypothetical protein [Kibdelosporangium philippinense]